MIVKLAGIYFDTNEVQLISELYISNTGEYFYCTMFFKNGTKADFEWNIINFADGQDELEQKINTVLSNLAKQINNNKDVSELDKAINLKK